MAHCETESMVNYVDFYLNNPRRRWRQAVTNVSACQKFRHALDLKLKAEKENTATKITAHFQEIQAAHIFIKEAQQPTIQPSHSDFGIGQNLHTSITSIQSNFLPIEEHAGANRLSITDEACNDEGLTDYFQWAKWLSQGARPKLVAPGIMVTLRVVLLTLVVLRSLVMIAADPTCVSGYVPGGNGATGGLVSGTRTTSGGRASDGEDGAASIKAGGSSGSNGGGGSEDIGFGPSSCNTAGYGSTGGTGAVSGATGGGGVVRGAGTSSRGAAAIMSGCGSSSCNASCGGSSCGAGTGSGGTAGDANGSGAGCASSISSGSGCAICAGNNGTAVDNHGVRNRTSIGFGGTVVASGSGGAGGPHTSSGGVFAITSSCCSGCCNTSGGVSSYYTGFVSGGTAGVANGRTAGCAPSTGCGCVSAICAGNNGTIVGSHGVRSGASTCSAGAAVATGSGGAGGSYTSIYVGGSHPTPIETSQELLQWMLCILGMGGAGGIGGMQVVDTQKSISIKILFVGINVAFGVCFLSAFLGIIAMAIQRFCPPPGFPPATRPPTCQLSNSQLKIILKISSIVSLMFMVVAIVMVIGFNITRQF